MKYKNFKLTLILFFISVFTFQLYSEQTKVYLLADKVNVRNAPSTDAKIVATLPISSKLTLLETTNKELTLKKYTAPWLKVKYEYKGKSKIGYIWKGLTTEKLAEANGITFLFGIESIKDKNTITYQIRATKNKKELDKIKFKGIGSLTTQRNLEVTGNKGLANVESILKATFSDEMCAGAFGDVIIFWNGKNLMYAITLTHGSDAPMFYQESLVYPNEKGGKPNTIIWKAKGGEHNEDGTESINESKQVEYRWNGNKLIKK